MSITFKISVRGNHQLERELSEFNQKTFKYKDVESNTLLGLFMWIATASKDERYLISSPYVCLDLFKVDKRVFVEDIDEIFYDITKTRLKQFPELFNNFKELVLDLDVEFKDYNPNARFGVAKYYERLKEEVIQQVNESLADRMNNLMI